MEIAAAAAISLFSVASFDHLHIFVGFTTF